MQSALTFTPPKPKYFLITSDIVIPLLVIIFVLFCLWLTLFSSLFSIQTIECQLDSRPCPSSSITYEINSAIGFNIFRYDTKNLVNRLTSADFTVRKVDVAKKLPHTLHLELSSVYPVVALQLVGGNDWLIFDEQLRLINNHVTDPNVPTVIVPGPISLRIGVAPTDPELRSALTLARSLATTISDFKSLSLDNHNLILTFRSASYTAILSPSGDIDQQITSLQAILRNATINQGVRVIDVRFAQPILKYN